MLEVAIKYADELKEKMYDIWFKDKYKYYNFCTYYQDIELDGETWNKHEFVSVSKKEGVIGFICSEVNRQANYCFGLGAVNFSEDKMTFGRDLGKALTDIFEKFNFNKLKFSVVVGNPIEKSYDKMIQKYGGRVVGIFREDARLIDGNLYDVKQYEILRSDYIRARKEN